MCRHVSIIWKHVGTQKCVNIAHWLGREESGISMPRGIERIITRFWNPHIMRIPKSCLSVRPPFCPYPEKRNHHSFVDISPSLGIDTSMERSALVLKHGKPKNWFFLNAYLYVPAVVFCKQCLAYTVHIDWCIDNSRTGLDTSKNQCSAPAVTALKNYWRYHVYNLFRLKNSSNVFAFIIIIIGCLTGNIIHDQLKLRPCFLPWVSKNRRYVSTIQSLFLMVLT